MGDQLDPDARADGSGQLLGRDQPDRDDGEHIRSVANTQGGTLADHARSFASTYTNIADALIVTWRDKARYVFWRPLTAIQQGDATATTRPRPSRAGRR